MIIKLFLVLNIFLQKPDSARTEPLMNTERDSIHTEMILRADQLLWQSGWNTMSTDRISYRVNNQLFGYYGALPSYLVDDIPVDPVFSV